MIKSHIVSNQILCIFFQKYSLSKQRQLSKEVVVSYISFSKEDFGSVGAEEGLVADIVVMYFLILQAEGITH